MNAATNQVVADVLAALPRGGVESAAAIVVDLENEAYARGWADGVDSADAVKGGMYVVAYSLMAGAGALVGAGITWACLRLWV